MNNDKNYVLFVEGLDDSRFFKMYFKNNDKIQDYLYADKKKSKVNNYLKSIKANSYFDYYLIADSDGKNVMEKKQDILNKYPDCEEEKIIIVCYEIESWYLAGISSENKERMKLKQKYDSTDNLSKEFFNSTIPNRFDSRIDYMIEILKIYNIDLACDKNNSFKNFNGKVT